jgi:predicted RNase H-like HicB family nuclease
MLTAYIAAAMKHATIDYDTDLGEFYGNIPQVPGVWATGADRDACRAELQSVLEGWLLVGLRHNAAIPPLNGITLTVEPVA